jgi:hypothetical protein
MDHRSALGPDRLRRVGSGAVVIEFLDPRNREEVLIACAGVALHGLLANDTHGMIPPDQLVANAFDIAREFLKQAERVQP